MAPQNRFAHGNAWLEFNTRVKHAWRSLNSLIGNLCFDPRVGEDSIHVRLREMHVPPVELECLIWIRGSENVVSLGMRRGHLPWVGSACASRALRFSSSRFLCRRPVLRSQIFGVHRRDVGTKPRRQRRRNRSSPALSQGRARPNCAGRPLVVGAVASPRHRVSYRLVSLGLPAPTGHRMLYCGVGAP
jgi:hypothetical protein